MNKAAVPFNFQMGLVGALLMGALVYGINLSAGWQGAAIAAGKQGLYTFLFGGLIVRFSENLSIRFLSKLKAILIAVVIPTLIAITATLVVHTFKGTPKPVLSTLPTAILAVPGFLFVAMKRRSRFDISKPNPTDN